MISRTCTGEEAVLLLVLVPCNTTEPHEDNFWSIAETLNMFMHFNHILHGLDLINYQWSGISDPTWWTDATNLILLHSQMFLHRFPPTSMYTAMLLLHEWRLRGAGTSLRRYRAFHFTPTRSPLSSPSRWGLPGLSTVGKWKRSQNNMKTKFVTTEQSL